MPADSATPEPQPPQHELTVIPAAALELITKAEIDTQVGIARKYRRSVAAFRQAALTMATVDAETAASCSYMVPRDGKMIDGPSIRLAEICVACWGNLRAGSRLVDEGEKAVTLQGFCHDLESNVAITVEVRRKVTNRFGVRYKDDMVQTAIQAGLAIALRNAVFNIVPRVYVEQVRAAAMKAAAGDETTLVERRAKALKHFTSLGISLERLLARLTGDGERKTGAEDITLADLTTLQGCATALRDGVATPEELFPLPEAERPVSSAAKLAEELGTRAKRKGAPEGPATRTDRGAEQKESKE